MTKCTVPSASRTRMVMMARTMQTRSTGRDDDELYKRVALATRIARSSGQVFFSPASHADARTIPSDFFSAPVRRRVPLAAARITDRQECVERAVRDLDRGDLALRGARCAAHPS